MKQSYLAITFIVLLFCSAFSYADSLSQLTLTDEEMKKLKMYFPSDDSEHLTWKGDPIILSLPLNKEKRIVFNEKVSVDLKGALNTDQLRILNNDKSLYLTAFQVFKTTRVFVTLKESGEVLLIDLKADEQASDKTQYIESKSITTKGHNVVNDLSYVDLIRFAWQQSYAPEKLINNNSEFSRVPMRT